MPSMSARIASALTPYTENILGACLDNEQDYILFLTKYATAYKNQMQAVARFRQFKISNSKMSFEIFEQCYLIDKKMALGKLFRQDITDADVEHFEGCIYAGRASLGQLYATHKEFPELMFQRILNKVIATSK